MLPVIDFVVTYVFVAFTYACSRERVMPSPLISRLDLPPWQEITLRAITPDTPRRFAH